MTTILVQALAVLMMLFFGAMAFYPLVLGNEPARRSSDQHAEDRVLHISPVPAIERLRPVPGHRPLPLGNGEPEDHSHRQDAA
ncbi:MAG TPA: hypothetical protein VNZ58_06655 [Thermomicrobiales bacterium]|nr:hypothetical protein [Thermomicrobiales bacterium]